MKLRPSGLVELVEETVAKPARSEALKKSVCNETRVASPSLSREENKPSVTEDIFGFRRE
jgi:hypothetical protein